jgi:hypothetical protein
LEVSYNSWGLRNDKYDFAYRLATTFSLLIFFGTLIFFYLYFRVKQGRLEPVQTYLKNNRRGLGADKDEKTAKKPYDTAASNEKNVLVSWQYSIVPFLSFFLLFFTFILIIHLFFILFVYGRSKPCRTLSKYN